MQQSITTIAKEEKVIPGQIVGVLAELGIKLEQDQFEVDSDTLELIKESVAELKSSKTVALPNNITPRDAAGYLGLPLPDIQKTLMLKMKVMATLTTTLKPEVAEKLFEEYGYKVRWVTLESAKSKSSAKQTSTTGAQPRPPVVTIMGHVDHGKTSLLDYIRKANVAQKEAGGITQHIGAYQVELPEGAITFLDTPGHEAFTAMRARGAMATDIAILVVSADDGIMAQTIEAIHHAQDAEVPIIVAVNKIDKPGANPERVLTQLTEHNLVPEAYGGQVITCNVSALTGEGVPHLLEMLLLQAEMMQLTADRKASFEGVVIEAKLERGRGPIATILVGQGTLKIGDVVSIGASNGKIRAMLNYKGERITEAGPAMPVEILGLNVVPTAGDTATVVADERAARNIADQKAHEARVKEASAASKHISLRTLRQHLEQGEVKELKLVVKADVQGSLEAIKGLIDKIENDEVKPHIIHGGVGTITESDVLLASAANAICIGFNAKPESNAKKEAERVKVEIRSYRIIYELIEDIEAAIKGMLEPKFEEQYRGTAEIRLVMNLSRAGKVAGSHVTDGKLFRNSKVRIKRKQELVYEGEIESLKHLKNDVKEMAAGFDCGIQFDDWSDFKEGDIVEAYEMVQID